MAFNSDTYHANKAAKRAWKLLAAAREHRDAGRHEQASFDVAAARSAMRLCLAFRPIGYRWNPKARVRHPAT